MGAKSQAYGGLFEKLFLKICRLNGVVATKIPDGCRQAGRQLIRVKTPCDWVLSYRNRMALIDTKTVHSDVFNCSAITEHQVNQLYAHETQGSVAGYVIWLRLTNRVFFLPASSLLHAMTERGSFSDSHPCAIYLGDQNFDIRKIFGTAGRHN